MYFVHVGLESALRQEEERSARGASVQRCDAPCAMHALSLRGVRPAARASFFEEHARAFLEGRTVLGLSCRLFVSLSDL